MTVGELKTALADVPDDMPVLIDDYTDPTWPDQAEKIKLPIRMRVVADGPVLPVGTTVFWIGYHYDK